MPPPRPFLPILPSHWTEWMDDARTLHRGEDPTPLRTSCWYVGYGHALHRMDAILRLFTRVVDRLFGHISRPTPRRLHSLRGCISKQYYLIIGGQGVRHALLPSIRALLSWVLAPDAPSELVESWQVNRTTLPPSSAPIHPRMIDLCRVLDPD